MKSTLAIVLCSALMLSACNPEKPAAPVAPAAPTAAASAVATAVAGPGSAVPENLTDDNWQNGVWVQKDGRNGFFFASNPSTTTITVGQKLTFSKSGERAVTEVTSNGPYVNIYVDQPLDAVGDGYPNKVTWH